MASIMDSFREVFSERFSLLKLLVLTVPAYYTFLAYNTVGFTFMVTLTSFILFGFIIRLTGNVINERLVILPSLNPITISYSAAKGIIALGPMTVILALLANFGCSFINILYWLDIVLKSVIWLVVASIIAISFLMFTAKESILDTYKLKTVFDKAGDLLLVIVFFIIQAAFVNGLIVGFLGYVIFLLFGWGSFLNFFLTFAVVFNIAVLGHYLGQTNYEVIVYSTKKEKKNL